MPLPPLGNEIMMAVSIGAQLGSPTGPPAPRFVTRHVSKRAPPRSPNAQSVRMLAGGRIRQRTRRRSPIETWEGTSWERGSSIAFKENFLGDILRLHWEAHHAPSATAQRQNTPKVEKERKAEEGSR
eukprot:CAMPEP_0197468918 /NCGR_PEP_ID=MMETSP1175-20131217/66331_1 /TAXON_ID=1003142 /ORGANISM="Triceratium dubium, Strain CCMP147" /LENGTH=126 /DNA_ID=CAMNT_0043005043 /DNA_START=1093 /DNA_END=1474 /DNA_ORIENTATION=+